MRGLSDEDFKYMITFYYNFSLQISSTQKSISKFKKGGAIATLYRINTAS